MNSTEKYMLVTDGIIEMYCVANSYEEATNLFLNYLKNKNQEYIKYKMNLAMDKIYGKARDLKGQVLNPRKVCEYK